MDKRHFRDRYIRSINKMQYYWSRVHKRDKKAMTIAIIKGIDGKLIQILRDGVKLHMARRNKQHRKAIANLIKKHKYESIGVVIGGRDCDGYDWASKNWFEFGRKDYDDKIITCPLKAAMKYVRGTMQGADGPTSYDLVNKEEYNKIEFSDPVGRCGWDDDSMEPWTPEEIREWEGVY